MGKLQWFGPQVFKTAILVAMMDFMMDFITTFQGIRCYRISFFQFFDQLTTVTFLIRILQMVRWQQGMVGN